MISTQLVPGHVSAMDAGKLEIELQEWQPREYVLTQSQILELMKLPGNLVEIQALPSGATRLRAKAVVGRLCTDHLEILIRPKCPVPSLLSMLAEAHELSKLVPRLVGYETSQEIVDLLVQVFLKQIDHITRLGLKRNYVPRQEDLQAVRGRINVRQTVTLHLRGQPRVNCSYEDYTIDVPENQLLLTALRAVSRNKALPSIRRSLAHMFTGEFPGVHEFTEGQRGWVPVTSDRLNPQYEPALKMALLILQSMGIQHEFGRAEVSSFTLDMNKLFEKFIFRKLQKLLDKKGVAVRAKQEFDFDEQKQAKIEPDLVFQSHQGRRVVGDTKYKLDSAPEPGDRYQMLAYCRILKVPCGILITAAATGNRLYTVKDGATTILVVPINLNRPLPEIEGALQALADQVLGLLSDTRSLSE